MQKATRGRGRIWLGTALRAGVLLAGVPVLAQDGSPVQPPRGEGPAIEPVAPQAPSASPQASVKNRGLVLPAEFDLAKTAQIPEGAGIALIAGTAVRLAEDMVVFVPDDGQRAGASPLDPVVPPMVLLPNQRLAQFSSSLSPRGDRGRVTLSGEVYTYRGLAHLMLTGYAFEAVTTPAAPQPSAANAASQAEQPKADPAALQVDARVQQLMQDLERTAPSRRMLDTPAPTISTSGNGRDLQPGAIDEGSLLSERTLITRARGRLIRLGSADGRYAFAFDNDPDSPARPPILLLPNAMLEQVENTMAGAGENLTIQVTGRVVTCRDKNYLLLVFFQVVQPNELVVSGQ